MEQKKKVWNMRTDREIDLRNLLWKLIRAWRVLLVLAVVFALTAAGISYMQSVQQMQQVSQVKKGLTEEEEEQVLRAQVIQQQLQEKEAYQNYSTIMNVDAYNKDQVMLQYLVHANVEESSVSVIADSYQQYIASKAIIKDIEDKIPFEDEYVGELISCTNYSVETGMDLGYSQEQLTTIKNDGDKILLVVVTGRTSEEASALADVVEVAVEAQGRNFAEHNLTLLNRYQSVVVDRELAKQQDELQVSIESLETRLENSTVNFTDEQKALLSGQGDFDSSEPINVNPQLQSPTVSKKKVVLSFLLGIIFACILVVLKYLLDGTVKSSDELQDMYGIRILGEMKMKKTSKKVLSPIDDLIAHIKSKGGWSVEEQLEVLLANISVMCQKSGIQRVFLADEGTRELANSELKPIMDAMKNNNLDIAYGTNIVYNAASLKQMADVGNIILIVREEQKKFKEIEKELTLCMDQEINVLGAIYLY